MKVNCIINIEKKKYNTNKEEEKRSSILF